MKKIALTDLLSIEEYNAQRPAIRQSMMDHKQTRRLPLGDNASIHFEDYMVMRYQVLELIRAEKYGELRTLKVNSKPITRSFPMVKTSKQPSCSNSLMRGSAAND